jgi:chromosome partitioning protein
MRVIAVASQKGGAGKTTLAAHLAVGLPGRVAIVDADPQRTLTEWWECREDGGLVLARLKTAELGNALRAMGGDFDFVVIDTPPAVTEQIRRVVRQADLVVVPVRPSPADLWAVGATLEIVRAERRDHVFVLTQAVRAAQITGRAAAALAAHGRLCPAVMSSRVGYATAMSTGRTLPEQEPRGAGVAEVTALCEWIAEEVGRGQAAA